MNMPNGYNEATASGEFTPVDLGGHYCVIKQVTETQSSTGKAMVVVLLDFCAPDKQPNYHSKAYENDTRQERKWPNNGTFRIMVADYQDPNKTSRNFKTFCTCFEKSNNCQVQWGGSNWGQQFKGKRIGVVYGEEENEYNGKRSMRHVPRWFCSWDNVANANIPSPKMLKNPATTAPGQEGFMAVPATANEDEGIPF